MTSGETSFRGHPPSPPLHRAAGQVGGGLQTPSSREKLSVMFLFACSLVFLFLDEHIEFKQTHTGPSQKRRSVKCAGDSCVPVLPGGSCLWGTFCHPVSAVSCCLWPSVDQASLCSALFQHFIDSGSPEEIGFSNREMNYNSPCSKNLIGQCSDSQAVCPGSQECCSGTPGG